MVTRRAVLKGTAAASIGAIAAAHGATPVEAATLSCGFGNLEGGAFGGFYKERDAFQVALKFHKQAAEIFIKEATDGGLEIFSKFFQKHWSDTQTMVVKSDAFPDLKLAELNFVKIAPESAQFFLKNELDQILIGTIGNDPKLGMFLKLDTTFPGQEISQDEIK